jgi:hypothetical protein
VEAARGPETSVSVVARRFGVNANLVFKWLKDQRYGGKPDGAAFLPVEVALPPAESDPGPADRTSLPPPPIIEHRSGIGTGQQLIQNGIGNDRRFASGHGGSPSFPSCSPAHEISDSPDRSP